MMRYPDGHKERTRDQILDAAAKVFREQGFAGSGLGSVMSEAGMTKGGFYAHFKSKEDLFAQALARAFSQSRKNWMDGFDHLSDQEWLDTAVARYLSPQHREMILDGCPVPALLSEISRSGEMPRQTFQEHLEEFMDEMGQRFPADKETGRKSALVMLAVFAGAMGLARAVKDDEVADNIFAVCREFLYTTLPREESPTTDASSADADPDELAPS